MSKPVNAWFTNWDMNTVHVGIVLIFCPSLSLQLKLVVEWELRDDNNKDYFCFKFPVQITS